MTCPRKLRTSLVLLLAGWTLPLAAQHERREEERRPDRPREGRPQEGREGTARPERRQDPAPWRGGSRPAREGREGEPPRSVPPGPGRSERRSERPGPARDRMERREAPEGTRPSAARESARPLPRETAASPRGAEAARAWQARETWRRNGWPARQTWQEHRARHWERDHRTWTQRGGYGGYRIPEPQFVARFGVRHPFLLGSRPVIYQGYPRFRCGGYWFLIVDPWPEFWVDDWYLTDAVYIDYDFDGYYLFNPRHPGIRLAVTIVL